MITRDRRGMSNYKLDLVQNSIYYLSPLCHPSNCGVIIKLQASNTPMPAQDLYPIIIQMFEGFLRREESFE